MMGPLYVIYAYEEVLGELVCHIYSGEPNQASWTEAEAQAQLAALQQRTPGLQGMVLPIELISA